MAGERTLPGIGLTGYWDLGSAFKTGMDSNLLKLSVLTQGRVKSQTTALPGSPTLGDIYIVPAGAGSNANEVAVWDGPSGSEAWVYLVPSTGWKFYVIDTASTLEFDGTTWVPSSGTMSGADIVAAIDAELGSEDWKTGGSVDATFPVLAYGRAYMTSDDPGLNFSASAHTLIFDAAIEVGGTFWDGGNPTRLTVPTGVSHVKLRGQVCFSALNADSNIRVYIFKNGLPYDAFTVMSAEGEHGGGIAERQISSPILEVAEGDFFEILVTCTDDSSIDITSANQRTWFEIEAVQVGSSSPAKGFRATKAGTSPQGFTSGAEEDVIFGAEDFDDYDSYDQATGVFTVPGPLHGKTVIFTAGVEVDDFDDGDLRLYRDAGIIARQRVADTAQVTTSVIVRVSEGEQYKVAYNHVGGSGNLVAAPTCFFAAVVVDTGGASGGGSSTLAGLDDVGVEEPEVADLNRVFGVKPNGVGGAEFGLLGTLDVNPLGGGAELLGDYDLNSTPVDEIVVENANKYSKIVFVGYNVDVNASVEAQFSQDNGATIETFDGMESIVSEVGTSNTNAIGNTSAITAIDSLPVISARDDAFFIWEIEGMDVNDGYLTVKRKNMAANYTQVWSAIIGLQDINAIIWTTASNMDGGAIKVRGYKSNVQPMIQDYEYFGTPGSAITLARKVAPTDISFAPGESGAFHVGSNPGGAESLDIEVDGSPVGTISIDGAGVCTVNFSSQTDVDKGSIISITSDGVRTFTDLFGSFWATVRA